WLSPAGRWQRADAHVSGREQLERPAVLRIPEAKLRPDRSTLQLRGIASLRTDQSPGNLSLPIAGHRRLGLRLAGGLEHHARVLWPIQRIGQHGMHPRRRVRRTLRPPESYAAGSTAGADIPAHIRSPGCDHTGSAAADTRLYVRHRAERAR